MQSVQQNYIGGSWAPAAAAAPNVNPSNTSDVIAEYARAQPAEAEAAIAAGKAAFPAYSRSTPQERYEALKKISDEILARKDEFLRNVTEKMLAYALGRGLEPYDIPTVRRITADVAKDNYRSSTLIREIVESYPFQYRKNL